ncbi:helix-turn-helix domain-containing protein [Nocardia sp. NPDC003999]
MTRELIPCDSFEWQRIVRRIKMQTTTKLVALLMSTYANRDGSHIIVGVVRLVAVTDTSKATIVRHLEALRSMGLIERVRQGNRHTGDADEYRLTVPSDVLDLPMLDPDERDESGDR